MRNYKFDSLYTNAGWLDNVYVAIGDNGKILKVSTSLPDANTHIESIPGWAIPGFQNAHSHAFQYSMAGSTERIPKEANGDNFWSWRNAMYQIANNITPETLEKIATQLYSEMLRHGYSSVAEFHYLHHDPKGRPYDNRAEMACRLIQAAKKAGIAVTIIPILYQQCDLKNSATQQQQRFLSNSIDDYWTLYESTHSACQDYSRANIGIGIHSIRAVPPEIITQFCSSIEKQSPIHIHIAEQMQEVNQCVAKLGKRPVAWLLDNVPLDKRFNLVHATHMTVEETCALAKTGANVILCPSTEGNLGDGFFPLTQYMTYGGSWAIGTDSHIGISPLEELRWLDYGQRLQQQKRNVLCLNEQGNSGELIFKHAYQGGVRAMGNEYLGFFEVGTYLDYTIIDKNHALLSGATKENRLSTLIYACDSSAILSTSVFT